MKNHFKCLLKSCQSTIPKSTKTILWLLKIILPVSLFVNLLQYWGIIAQIARLLAPAFSLLGLPGESAIVFISSIFLPLYAPIAIIAGLSQSMREITILALMCLISHNMLVETAIQKKTGSKVAIMFLVRILSSFAGAFILNLLLPVDLNGTHIVSESLVYSNITEVFLHWLLTSGILSLKIALIIIGLMMLQNILKEFNTLNALSRFFAPFMKIMGLPGSCSFLWIIAQTLGLTYGSAIMIESVENKEITKKEANLLNYHIAVNHSLLEDTLLFVAIGVPAIWIIIPRFILAIIVVLSVRNFLTKK